jgi:diaminohydroxyphosphoribosylaminopyrimidine deaminase / 5-amino-6-(5-phosphoribosylamino)uracil reductase
MTAQDDIHHMRHALTLARRGLGRTWPNPAVGCVIVKNDVVIGRGWTQDSGRPHAETEALKQAGPEAKGASVYVTLEPCSHHGKTPPCAQALIDAGVARVVIGCGDPDPRVNGKGIEMLKNAGIKVETDVLENEAQELNAGFFLRVTKSRPFITLKSATSMDGKIAPEEGKRQWITGVLSHRHVHLERSQHDAILAGIGTVLADDPMLTARLPGYEHRIVRVILDTHLRIAETSKLVKGAREYPLWIFHKSNNPEKEARLAELGAELFHIDPANIKAVVAALAEEGITRLMVEGGAKVHTSFLEAGLCDRFLWFHAPAVTIGRVGVDVLQGHQIGDLSAKFGLEKRESRALEQDLLEIYTRKA